MRGEHHIKDDFEGTWKGSSPHARGAPLANENPNALTGIIPACAGSTSPP